MTHSKNTDMMNFENYNDLAKWINKNLIIRVKDLRDYNAVSLKSSNTYFSYIGQDLFYKHIGKVMAMKDMQKTFKLRRGVVITFRYK